MKICIVASVGGHLQQCLKLMPVLKNHKVFIITFSTKHMKSSLRVYKKYLVENPQRKPIKYILGLPLFYKILKKENPDIIISTGAGVAVPFFILGKYLFKSKLIFIESLSRIYEPSQTGQILYHISDLFIVQWKPLLDKYGRKAVYGGTII